MCWVLHSVMLAFIECRARQRWRLGYADTASSFPRTDTLGKQDTWHDLTTPTELCRVMNTGSSANIYAMGEKEFSQILYRVRQKDTQKSFTLRGNSFVIYTLPSVVAWARQTFTIREKKYFRKNIAKYLTANLGKDRLDVTEPSSANVYAIWHLIVGCHNRGSQHTSHKPSVICLPSTL